jgi:hypothetical protein
MSPSPLKTEGLERAQHDKHARIPEFRLSESRQLLVHRVFSQCPSQ